MPRCGWRRRCDAVVGGSGVDVSRDDVGCAGDDGGGGSGGHVEHVDAVAEFGVCHGRRGEQLGVSECAAGVSVEVRDRAG
jgi:hypothetical protein